MRSFFLLAAVLLAGCGSLPSPAGRTSEPMATKPLASPAPAAPMVVVGTAATGLVPVDLAMCFVMPDRPATLRWTVATRGPDERVPYRLSDYAGHEVASGDARLAGDGTVTLTRSFAAGWYELAFPAAGQAFGIVAIAPQAGPVDPFFAIDAGLSWLETDPGRRQALVAILARCGISMARERMGVGAVHPDREGWTWDAGRRGFDALRATYARDHVPLLEMLHGGAGHLGMVADSPYPQDLAATAATWIAIAGRWQGGWGAVEVENEPDLQPRPADHYVAQAKTVSWALQQARCPLPVVAGAFGSIPPGPFFDACAANGLLADADAISFHSYDRAPAVEGLVARYRTWLAGAGAAALPLWHSECGWPWVKGPGRPPRDQDAASACEIAAKAVESRACGVARHFPFVYVYYEEGHKNFGMMGREATPLRSMAAYAVAVQTLGGLPYRGDLRGVGAPVVLARVFGGDAGPWVAVLYSGDPSPTARVRLPLPALRAAGADGRNLALAGDELPLPDGLTYLWLDPALARSALVTDTGAARLYALGRQPLQRPRLAAPVVIQPVPGSLPARTSARCYLVGQEQARALPVRARLANLADTAVAVRPALGLPGRDPIPGAPLTLPAHGSAEAAWTVDATAALAIAAIRLVTVTAAVDGVQPASLAIPLVMEGTLEQHLAAHPLRRPLPFTELPRWQANNAGHGHAAFAVDDGTWRMAIGFGSGSGNWAYPIFALPARLDPAHDRGLLLRARILQPAGNVAIMADPNTPGSFWCPDLFPADGQWHVVFVPFEEFKPGPNGAGMQNTRLDIAAWTRLAIGMGSATAENALEISQLLVVGE